MCNNHAHGQAHGVRSNEDKVCADLRDNLVAKLNGITKIEAQIPVIAEEDFPMVNEVTAVLAQIVREEKRHAAALMKLINKIDQVQSEMFLSGLRIEETDDHDHEHDDTDHGAHSHEHSEHGHSH
jgi:rubrerythrin